MSEAAPPDFSKGASGSGDPYAITGDLSYLASLSASASSASSASNSFPPGCVTDYAGTGSPTGWVLCDGSSYLRTGGTYDALFAAIGTTYGAADGNHFNVPDCRGRVTVGLGTNGDVNALGLNEGSTVGNRRPKHPHTVTDPTHSHTIPAATGGPSSGGGGGNFTSPGPTSTSAVATGVTVGVTGTASDAPAYFVLNKIIKL